MQLLKPVHPRACAPQQKKPQQGEAQALKLESSPDSLQLEKAGSHQWRPSATKNKLIQKNAGTHGNLEIQ